ncbi:MAG TPA: DNA cytosine methyltransferase, partial [Trebonia sp.]
RVRFADESAVIQDGRARAEEAPEETEDGARKAALSIVAQLNDHRRRPAAGNLTKRAPLSAALTGELTTKISAALASNDPSEILAGDADAVVSVRFGSPVARMNAPPVAEIEATLYTPDRAALTARASAAVTGWTGAAVAASNGSSAAATWTVSAGLTPWAAIRRAESGPGDPADPAGTGWLPVRDRRAVARAGYRLSSLDTERLKPALLVAMLRAGVPGDRAATVAATLMRNGLDPRSLVRDHPGADGGWRQTDYDATPDTDPARGFSGWLETRASLAAVPAPDREPDADTATDATDPATAGAGPHRRYDAAIRIDGEINLEGMPGSGALPVAFSATVPGRLEVLDQQSERFVVALKEQAVAPRPGGTGGGSAVRNRLRRRADWPRLRSRPARARLFPAGRMPGGRMPARKMQDLDALLDHAGSRAGLTVLRLVGDDADGGPADGGPADPMSILRAGLTGDALERRLWKLIGLQQRGKLRVFQDPGPGGGPRQLTVGRHVRYDRDEHRVVIDYRAQDAAEDVPLSDAARGYALHVERNADGEVVAGRVGYGWTSAHAEVNPALAARPRPSRDTAWARLFSATAEGPRRRLRKRRPGDPARRDRARTDDPLEAPAAPRPTRPDEEELPPRAFDLDRVAGEVRGITDRDQRNEALKRAADRIVAALAHDPPGDKARPVLLDGDYLGDGLVLAYAVAQVTGRGVWARGVPVDGSESWFRADPVALELDLASRLGQPGTAPFIDELALLLAYVRRNEGVLVRVTDPSGAEHLASLAVIGEAGAEPSGLRVTRPDGTRESVPAAGIAEWAERWHVKVPDGALREARVSEYVPRERLGDLRLGDDVRIPAYARDGESWGGASVVLRLRGQVLEHIAAEIGIPVADLPEDLEHALRYSPLEVSGDGKWFTVKVAGTTYLFRLQATPRGDWQTTSDGDERLRIDVTNQGVSGTGSAGTQTTTLSAAPAISVGPFPTLFGGVFTFSGELTFSTAIILGRTHQYRGSASARAEGDKGRGFLAGVNYALTVVKVKDGTDFDPAMFRHAVGNPKRFAVDRGAEVKLPHDVTLTEAEAAKTVEDLQQAAEDAWLAANQDLAAIRHGTDGPADDVRNAIKAAREAVLAPTTITFGDDATIGWLSVPLHLSSLDEARQYLLERQHEKASRLTEQSISTEAHPAAATAEEAIRFLSQQHVRAHHREAATAVISSNMLHTPIRNLRGVPALGDHEMPLGTAQYRMRPRTATLLKEFSGTELRGAGPALTGAARRLADASSRAVGAAAGPAITPAVSAFLKLRAAVAFGGRFSWNRTRILNVGGAAEVGHMLNAKGDRTALYEVEHQVQVRMAGDAWSELFTVRTWEHMTVEEARRLAAQDQQFTKRAEEPQPPEYLTQNHPLGLGLAYPAQVRHRDGAHYDRNGDSVVEAYTDYVVRHVSALYPKLVQPQEQLDILRYRNDLAKGNLAKLGSEYDEARFSRLQENLEKIRTEVRGALLNNPEGLLTGDHDDGLTGAREQDQITPRLFSHGIPVALKLSGLTRNKRLVLTLHAKMSNRRYAGTAESFGFRSGTTGRADQSGGYRTGRGVEGTVDVSAQVRDNATDTGHQSARYGGFSLGVRGGRQWIRTMGYGGSAQAVTVGVIRGPVHAWDYDLDLYARVGGFARPKRWLRYLSLGIASWNRWIKELGTADDPFRVRAGTSVEPVRAVVTLLTADSHSRRERLDPPGPARTDPLSAARTNWLLSGRRLPESPADKALQEKLAGIMKLPFHASSHRLTEAVIALGAEVTDGSAPYTRTGAEGVSAVRDTFEHLAANLRQLTGLTAWPLSGFITRQAFGEWTVRYQVNRSLSNLQLVSDPAKKSELELSVLTERGSTGGKSRVTSLSFGTGAAGTTNLGPQDAPDAMLSGGLSWTPLAWQWTKGGGETVTAVRDTNFIPVGPAYLVRADATDYVAAEGIRTVAGLRLPFSTVRRAGKRVEDPGSVYFYVTEDEAYELGLLQRHPSDEGRVLDQPWQLKPEIEDRPVAAYLRKQPDLSRFIAEVRADLAGRGFDDTDVNAVEAHLSALSIDANFMEMARGRVSVPLGHFGAKGMVTVGLKRRGNARFVGRDGTVKWQHRIHALLASVVSRAKATSTGYGLSFTASHRPDSGGLFGDGGNTVISTSNQSARGTDLTVTEQRTYQATDTSSAAVFDHDYDVVVTVMAAGRADALSTAGTFRVAHPLSSADPVLVDLGAPAPAAGAVKAPDPITRPLDHAAATPDGIRRWLRDDAGRLDLLDFRNHLRVVPMDVNGQAAVTQAARRAVAASERSFLEVPSPVSQVVGDYDLGADGLTKDGSQSDDAIRNATTTNGLGAFLQAALHHDDKLGGTGYGIPGVIQRGIGAELTLYARPGLPRDAKVISYDPNLRDEKPARLITGTDTSETETSAGVVTEGPAFAAFTDLGNVTSSGPATGMPAAEAVGETVPATETVSQNEKLTGPAYLIDIPVTWRAVAQVKHQAADPLTGGTSGPRAFEAESYVRAWVDEKDAIELGLVTREAAGKLAAANLKKAEEDPREALDAYRDARRDLLGVPHRRDEQSEQDIALIDRAASQWAEVVRLEDTHRRVRTGVNQIVYEINTALAGPDDSDDGSSEASDDADSVFDHRDDDDARDDMSQVSRYDDNEEPLIDLADDAAHKFPAVSDRNDELTDLPEDPGESADSAAPGYTPPPWQVRLPRNARAFGGGYHLEGSPLHEAAYESQLRARREAGVAAPGVAQSPDEVGGPADAVTGPRAGRKRRTVGFGRIGPELEISDLRFKLADPEVPVDEFLQHGDVLASNEYMDIVVEQVQAHKFVELVIKPLRLVPSDSRYPDPRGAFAAVLDFGQWAQQSEYVPVSSLEKAGYKVSDKARHVMIGLGDKWSPEGKALRFADQYTVGAGLGWLRDLLGYALDNAFPWKFPEAFELIRDGRRFGDYIADKFTHPGGVEGGDRVQVIVRELMGADDADGLRGYGDSVFIHALAALHESHVMKTSDRRYAPRMGAKQFLAIASRHSAPVMKEALPDSVQAFLDRNARELKEFIADFTKAYGPRSVNPLGVVIGGTYGYSTVGDFIDEAFLNNPEGPPVKPTEFGMGTTYNELDIGPDGSPVALQELRLLADMDFEERFLHLAAAVTGMSDRAGRRSERAERWRRDPGLAVRLAGHPAARDIGSLLQGVNSLRFPPRGPGSSPARGLRIDLDRELFLDAADWMARHPGEPLAPEMAGGIAGELRGVIRQLGQAREHAFHGLDDPGRAGSSDAVAQWAGAMGAARRLLVVAGARAGAGQSRQFPRFIAEWGERSRIHARSDKSRRSPGAGQIDLLVERLGNEPGDRELHAQVLAAIRRWRATKEDPAKARRAAAVGELEEQVIDHLGSLWRGPPADTADDGSGPADVVLSLRGGGRAGRLEGWRGPGRDAIRAALGLRSRRAPPAQAIHGTSGTEDRAGDGRDRDGEQGDSDDGHDGDYLEEGEPSDGATAAAGRKRKRPHRAEAGASAGRTRDSRPRQGGVGGPSARRLPGSRVGLDGGPRRKRGADEDPEWWRRPEMPATVYENLPEPWRHVVDALEAEIAAGRNTTNPDSRRLIDAARSRLDEVLARATAAGDGGGWRQETLALLQYWRRTGHSFAAKTHREELEDGAEIAEVRPGDWLSLLVQGEPRSVPDGVLAVVSRLEDARGGEILASARAEADLGWHGPDIADAPRELRGEIRNARARLDAALADQEGNPPRDLKQLANVRLAIDFFRQHGNLEPPRMINGQLSKEKAWLGTVRAGYGTVWVRKLVDILDAVGRSESPFDENRVLELLRAEKALERAGKEVGEASQQKQEQIEQARARLNDALADRKVDPSGKRRNEWALNDILDQLRPLLEIWRETGGLNTKPGTRTYHFVFNARSRHQKGKLPQVWLRDFLNELGMRWEDQPTGASAIDDERAGKMLAALQAESDLGWHGSNITDAPNDLRQLIKDARAETDRVLAPDEARDVRDDILRLQNLQTAAAAWRSEGAAAITRGKAKELGREFERLWSWQDNLRAQPEKRVKPWMRPLLEITGVRLQKTATISEQRATEILELLRAEKALGWAGHDIQLAPPGLRRELQDARNGLDTVLAIQKDEHTWDAQRLRVAQAAAEYWRLHGDLLLGDEETVTVGGAEYQLGYQLFHLRRRDLGARIGEKGLGVPRWHRQFLDELGMRWDPGGLGLGAEREQRIIDAVAAEVAAGRDSGRQDTAVPESLARTRARTDEALAEAGTETQGALADLRGLRALLQLRRAGGDLVRPAHHELVGEHQVPVARWLRGLAAGPGENVARWVREPLSALGHDLDAAAQRPGRTLTSLDMFSGAGGMAEGARQAGFAVMAAVDNDPAAAQTLRLNRYSSRAGTPVSPQDQAPLVTADARTMDLTRWKGTVNLLTGDIPGEEWSRMGEMRGPEGRNNLWPAFIRAMRQVEPEVAVAEIVPGIVAGRFTDYRRYIMRAMAAPVVQPRPGESWQDHSSRLAVALASRDDARAERYDVQWVRLNAADYEGGPQVRQRVFFVAIRRDVEGLAGWSPPPPTHSKTALIRDQNEGGYWERHPDAPQHVREAKDLPDGMRLPPDDGLRPWVTIRDAIGEHLGDAPAREGAPGEIDDLDWPISTLSGRTTVVRRDDGTIAEVGLDGLAALQQYPDGYQFAGLLREQRRLIFDSTPVGLGRALFRSLAAGLYTAERPAGSGTARPPGPPATSKTAPARRLVRRGPAPRPLSRGARRHRASRRGGSYDSPFVDRVLRELGLVKNAELWRPSARHEDMTTPGGRTRQGIVPDSTGPGYLVEIKGQGKVTAMRQIRLEHALAKRAGQKLWIITRAGARVNSKVSDLAEDTGGGVLFRLESGTYQDTHGNEVTIAPGMQVTGYQRWRPDDAVGGGAGTAASRGAPGDEERPGSPDGGDGGGLFVSQPGSPSNDGSAGNELSPAEDVDDTPFVDRVLRELGLTKNTRLWRAPPEVAAAKDGRTRRGIVPDARGRHYVVEIKDRRRLEFTNQIALEHLLATGSGRKLWIIAREGADVARGVVNNAEDTGGGVLIRLDSGTYQDFYGNQVAVGPRMKVTGYRGRRDVSPGRGGSGQGEGSDEDSASDGDQDNGDDIDWQPGGQDDPVRTRPATPQDPAGQIAGDGSSDDEPLAAPSGMQMLARMANRELARRDAALSGMQMLAEAANLESARRDALRREAARLEEDRRARLQARRRQQQT